jgi:hypothetical protein
LSVGDGSGQKANRPASWSFIRDAGFLFSKQCVDDLLESSGFLGAVRSTRPAKAWKLFGGM